MDGLRHREPSALPLQPAARVPDPLPPFDEFRRIAAKKGIVWSKLRERVLLLFWMRRAPLGVYDIARQLSSDGQRVHPTSVYRCIREPCAAGLIIEIVSWKRYVISPDPLCTCWLAMLCPWCRNFALTPHSSAKRKLRELAEKRYFVFGRAFIESSGKCASCRANGAELLSSGRFYEPASNATKLEEF